MLNTGWELAKRVGSALEPVQKDQQKQLLRWHFLDGLQTRRRVERVDVGGQPSPACFELLLAKQPHLSSVLGRLVSFRIQPNSTKLHFSLANSSAELSFHRCWSSDPEARRLKLLPALGRRPEVRLRYSLISYVPSSPPSCFRPPNSLPLFRPPPSTLNMVPTLPPEIIDRIIELVREATYAPLAPAAACALVCESWLPAARRALYRCLDVAGEDVLDQVSGSYMSIRHIMGTNNFAPLVTKAEVMPLGYAEVTQVLLQSLDAERCLTSSQVLVVAVQCTSLRSLHLHDLPGTTLNWLVTTCPRPPVAFPSLHHLFLSSNAHATSARFQIPADELPTGLSNFLPAITTLEAFSMEGFGIATELILPSSCTRFSVQLPVIDVNSRQLLSVDKARHFLIRAISLQTVPAVSLLRKLSLKYVYVDSAEARAIKSLLAACPHLKDLHLPGQKVTIVAWTSPSLDHGRLQELDITRSLPTDLEILSATYTASDFIAEGVLAYLQDESRSGKLRALETRLKGHWELEEIRDVCSERRIWLNGMPAREPE